MKLIKRPFIVQFALTYLFLFLNSLGYAQTLADFYALHVGDYWIYHADSLNGTYKPTTKRDDIENIDLINGIEYFRMKQKIFADDSSEESAWYTWLRSDTSGIVLGAFGESPDIATLNIPAAIINVDGDATDWSGINALLTDPQGDDSATYSGDDIKAIYAARDMDNLYIRLDLWDDANRNFGNGPSPREGIYRLLVDNDGPFPEMQLGIGYDDFNYEWSLGYNGSNDGVPDVLQGSAYVGVSGGIIEVKLPFNYVGASTNFYSIEAEVTNCCVQNSSTLDEAGSGYSAAFSPPVTWIPNKALVAGTSWELYTHRFGGTLLFNVESISETVQVPAGTFTNCLKIKLTITGTEQEPSQTSYSYLAKGIGEVLNKGWGYWEGNSQFELTDYYVQGSTPTQFIDVETDKTPVAGKILNVTARLPENFLPTTQRLYYRKPGESLWRWTDITAPANVLTFTIPADAVSYQGVEYYVYLSDGIRAVTYPPVNPQANPAHVQVAVASQVYPLRLSGLTYKMVSVPIYLENPEICKVLCDDYQAYDIQQWRLLQWQSQTDSTGYFEYPKITAGFTPGQAFWLVTRSGKTFDVENGWSINTTEPVQFTLKPGWNQVANPFPFPVSIDSMEAELDTLQLPVYYNGREYVYEQQILQPWEGYFVYNEAPRSIFVIVPPKPYQGGLLLKQKSLFAINEENEYLLQLSACMPETKWIDSQNYIGFREQATSGHDKFDLAEAPPIGDFLRLSILENGERFASNFKAINELGQQWEIQISLSEFIKKPIEIALNETGTLPANFKLYILDKKYSCSLPIENQKCSFELTREAPVREIKIIIGTEAFAQQNSENIALNPIEYSLAQNYLNPFNSETIIRYQLGRRTPVELSIFDLLGRTVRQLVNETQTTGSHVARWNGLSTTNDLVASGVYFCRIKAGDFVSTKKIILVR